MSDFLIFDRVIKIESSGGVHCLLLDSISSNFFKICISAEGKVCLFTFTNWISMEIDSNYDNPIFLSMQWHTLGMLSNILLLDSCSLNFNRVRLSVHIPVSIKENQ